MTCPTGVIWGQVVGSLLLVNSLASSGDNQHHQKHDEIADMDQRLGSAMRLGLGLSPRMQKELLHQLSLFRVSPNVYERVEAGKALTDCTDPLSCTQELFTRLWHAMHSQMMLPMRPAWGPYAEHDHARPYMKHWWAQNPKYQFPNPGDFRYNDFGLNFGSISRAIFLPRSARKIRQLDDPKRHKIPLPSAESRRCLEMDGAAYLRQFFASLCEHFEVLHYRPSESPFHDLSSTDTPETRARRESHWYGDLLDESFLSGQHFRVILLLSVLEHVVEPLVLMASLRRLLQEDGFLVISAPHISPQHDDDYYRYTSQGMRAILTGSGLSVEILWEAGGMEVSIGEPLGIGVWTAVNTSGPAALERLSARDSWPHTIYALGRRPGPRKQWEWRHSGLPPCWIPPYSSDTCCKSRNYGGMKACFDDKGIYTFDRCCAHTH